ncbi:hypothetical protein E2C01_022603 [Portunus trituberculatus]|uniref:Uncharacterized protein n=1 Tax=Portunus trituberculatus TaxID=210409 RepID=A0A5B7E9B6_PORTR|nr:hypothetical protein [Portunus trituberculatus]
MKEIAADDIMIDCNLSWLKVGSWGGVASGTQVKAPRLTDTSLSGTFKGSKSRHESPQHASSSPD